MSSTTAPTSRSAKRGSSFSDKQIAQTVKDGNPVQFNIDGESHYGWVYGADDFHWGIVDATGTVRLVHKSLACLTILEGVKAPSSILPVIEPFRAYVMRTYFGQNATS